LLHAAHLATLLFVRQYGTGQPIVFIHGFGANSNTWRKVVPQFAETHRVVTVDLKGFGLSDKPLDDRYSVQEQAQLVAQLIQNLRLNNTTLVGHSFGGAVALSAARILKERHSNAVRRMVLIDSAAYPQPLPPSLAQLATPGIVSLTPPEAIAKGILFSSHANPFNIERRDVYAYARPLYEPGGKHALVATLEALNSQVGTPDPSRLYRSLGLPALLIWCARDPIAPLSVGLRLQADLNARLEVLHECSHAPQEEQPLSTAAIIREFLQKRPFGNGGT